ncbi:uncharacterized protein LY89DRAFT_203927 [Mollisia scopiformis]|uniref:Uncharacterized protein n=1 Tax=Mollisia scopiformis TaxID=149040 RepID=A0A194WWB7_MOLSC|nr:uncharacterized protein LY89DRAFT_203927 [Mollisia scopiformis]KUJ12266.1 hypothetical protein LY89DRAFT_203927 [Mollisia scopiformis]
MSSPNSWQSNLYGDRAPSRTGPSAGPESSPYNSSPGPGWGERDRYTNPRENIPYGADRGGRGPYRSPYFSSAIPYGADTGYSNRRPSPPPYRAPVADMGYGGESGRFSSDTPYRAPVADMVYSRSTSRRPSKPDLPYRAPVADMGYGSDRPQYSSDIPYRAPVAEMGYSRRSITPPSTPSLPYRAPVADMGYGTFGPYSVSPSRPRANTNADPYRSPGAYPQYLDRDPLDIRERDTRSRSPDQYRRRYYDDGPRRREW